MRFEETKLKGAYLLDIEKIEDDRGFFSRFFCKEEFESHGINPFIAQGNLSFNRDKGTLRGMHYQVSPAKETKFIRCTKGAIYDVIVDLRVESPTYRKWFGVELSESNYRMLYVPQDFAHGFITLSDNTEISYLVSEFYTPGCEKGLRWDDPAIGIKWPEKLTTISEKDASWPLTMKKVKKP